MLIFLHGCLLRFILHFDCVCVEVGGRGGWVCMYECMGPHRPEEGIQSSGTEVTNCELPIVSAGDQNRVFGKTSVCS